MTNILPHAQDSVNSFISAGNFANSDETLKNAESFIGGWEACVDHLVDFAQTSKDVPGVFRKKLATALLDARSISGEAPSIASSESARLGWVACIEYITTFVKTSGEVPSMFRKKVITALTDVAATPTV